MCGTNICVETGFSSTANPKGIAASSPRLARWRLPWVSYVRPINPNGVVAKVTMKAA